jgi:hypothetical protein
MKPPAITPDDVLRLADAVVGQRRSGRAALIDAAARAIIMERERIAAWHEAQADALEAAIQQVLHEGGVIETSRRSLVELHRGFAAAIRRGAA